MAGKTIKPAKKTKATGRTPRTRAPVRAIATKGGTSRLWLMFPPRQIRQPVIWDLGRKFKVVTNIRQASITDELGIVCLELQGPGSEIARAIQWLEKLGINVEPVEITVLES